MHNDNDSSNKPKNNMLLQNFLMCTENFIAIKCYGHGNFHIPYYFKEDVCQTFGRWYSKYKILHFGQA